MNMHKILIASALSMLLAAPSQAQLLGGVQGNAAGWVEAGCNACCFVVNKSSKRIKATLALAMGSSISQTVFPGDRKTFTLGQNCMTSGFALIVEFIPDDPK